MKGRHVVIILPLPDGDEALPQTVLIHGQAARRIMSSMVELWLEENMASHQAYNENGPEEPEVALR